MTDAKTTEGLSDIEKAVLGLRTEFLEMRLSYDQVISAMVKLKISHPVAVTIASAWDEEWEKKFDSEAPPPGPVIPRPQRRVKTAPPLPPPKRHHRIVTKKPPT